MTFVPLTPANLVTALADWVLSRAARPDGAATVVGFDGLAEIGTTELADQVAESLRDSGRQIIRASTRWWWRTPALRLEFGRQDVDMLLTGWVDADALRRELIDPVLRAGTGYLTRLRDPTNGRSIRQQPETPAASAILLLDGPFLLAADVALDGLVGLAVSQGRVQRALPEEQKWWAGAIDRYQDEYASITRADVLLSYDHPNSPAASGLITTRTR